jgi:hypothetical protein
MTATQLEELKYRCLAFFNRYAKLKDHKQAYYWWNHYERVCFFLDRGVQ